MNEQKTNIVILGGGFAGRGAAEILAKSIRKERQLVEITLIDRHSYTTMLPALPDVAGTRIPPGYLTEEVVDLISADIKFLQASVRHVDLTRQVVTMDRQKIGYDYLIIATGSTAEFFGFDQNLDSVYKLASLEDAERIGREFPDYLRRAENPTAVVAGGGYTGLELACNLRYAAHKFGGGCDIAVVELADQILPNMSTTIRAYIEKRCAERNINLLTGRSVSKFDGTDIELSDGTVLKDAFLCWSTGTKFELPVEGEQESLKDGRIIVDSTLQIPQYPGVFAAGDAAAMNFGGGYLRKAVNFSLYSGQHAARNISRLLDGRAASPFKPIDLGWVIPFCNAGAGKMFSRFTVKGRFPLALHYFMCGYRNYNTANRLHFLKMALAALRCRD
ncbi:MAG: FAD-dependent oxidoreductase [Lentisphaeria bacterium]